MGLLIPYLERSFRPTKLKKIGSFFDPQRKVVLRKKIATKSLGSQFELKIHPLIFLDVKK